MSWSFEHVGTKEGVAKATVETLANLASNYKGKQEGYDILAIRERAAAIIEALAPADRYGEFNGVIVKGNGSHSVSGDGITSASFTLSVTRLTIKL